MRPKFDTKITRLFGIELPIIQGAMAWLSEAELVAAVSNQGGLGVLGAASASVDELEAQIRRTRTLTDRPIAVNFALVLADFDAHLDRALALGVKIIFVSAGSAKRMTPRIKEAGALCVHVVPNKKLALSVEQLGVDAVVLESYEAGGHLSPEGITALTNIPNVSRDLRVPLIAAGGIVDGRGMAAALVLGADAIQMGTRFLLTQENNANPLYKKMLLDAGEMDTPVYSKAHHPGRALRTPVVERVLGLERDQRPVEEIRSVIGMGRARKAAHGGDLDEGLFFSGAGAAMIDRILTVAEVFDTLIRDYADAIARLRGLSRA